MSRSEPPSSSRFSRSCPGRRSSPRSGSSRSGDPHHDDDLASARRRAARRGGGPQPAELAHEELPLAGLELEARRGRTSARSLGPTSPGDRDDDRREPEQPRERDLGRGRSCASATSASSSRRARRPGARRGPPRGECATSAIPSSSQRSTTPPRSARSSKGLSATWTAAMGARSSASSSWPRGDVRDADALDEAVVDESRERAHGRPPRRARGPARGRGRGRSAARPGLRGSPRSRPGACGRARRAPRRRPSAPSRPS